MEDSKKWAEKGAIELDLEIPPSVRSQKLTAPKSVVLTGPTGFYGAFVLGELIKST